MNRKLTSILFFFAFSFGIIYAQDTEPLPADDIMKGAYKQKKKTKMFS